MMGTRAREASTGAGAFDAAPEDPYEFLQGYGAFRLGLILPSPAPYIKAPALRASYRGRRERLPPYPLGGGRQGKNFVVTNDL